jgi:delta 1-pyrroline-5-carboxylate dehydrogenase
MTDSEAQNEVAAGAGYCVPFFIDGKEVHTEQKFDVVSPSSGEIVHRCSSATTADALAAVDAATTAFKSWRKSTPGERRDIFLKTVEVMNKRKDELCQYLMDETGGSRPWAEFNIMVATDLIKDVAGRIPTIEGSIPMLADGTVSGLVLKEPYGVILAIAPWYGLDSSHVRCHLAYSIPGTRRTSLGPGLLLCRSLQVTLQSLRLPSSRHA